MRGITLKRFVKGLMADLRALVLPDATKPDASIFSQFFSAPRQVDPERKKKSSKMNVVIIDPPTPKTRVFLIDALPDGFRIRANPEYAQWPVNLRAEIAYADGSRKPSWSRHDFQINNLEIKQEGGGERTAKGNILICRECDSSFALAVQGFDQKRELVTNIRAFRNA